MPNYFWEKALTKRGHCRGRFYALFRMGGETAVYPGIPLASHRGVARKQL